jgi:hypothetical protein
VIVLTNGVNFMSNGLFDWLKLFFYLAVILIALSCFLQLISYVGGWHSIWTKIWNFVISIFTKIKNLFRLQNFKKLMVWLLVVGIPTALLYYGLSDYFVSWRLNNQKYRILVPLESTSREFLDYIESGDVPSGEKDFSSRTSKNIRNIINSSKNNWVSEFGNEPENLKEKVDFYFFPEGFDNGYETENDSYQRSYNKAKEIAEKDGVEIVGLIGNISSTTTLKYAEFCGKDGVAMILPLATASNLMNNLKVKGVTAAIRLPPANDKQTQIISSFLRESQKKKLTRSLILKDLTNPVYSSDLVDGFRDKYVQTPLTTYINRTNDEPNVKHEDDFGRILGVVPIGRDSSPFLYPSLNDLKTESLLIFGMTDPTLEVLAQAKANKLNYEQVVLTDGAVDEYLLERIEGIVDKQNQNKIHLVFPLPCPLPTALNEIMDGNGYKQKLEMTHGIYVADSVYLILGTLKNNTKTTPKFHQFIWRWVSGSDVKYYIRKDIEKWRESAKNNSPIKLDIPFKATKEEDKRTYFIDELGNSVELEYHVFQIKRLEKNKLKPTLFWEHDSECPVEKKGVNNFQLKCVEPPVISQEPVPNNQKKKK